VFNKYFVQYHHSTCQTAIIYEKDDDFADITVPDMTPSISQTPLLSQRIDPSHLSFRLSAARNIAKRPWQLFGLFLRYSSILYFGTTLLQNDCLFTRSAKLRPEVQAQFHELQSLGDNLPI